MSVSAAVRLEGKRTGPLWSTDGSRKYTDQYRVITSGDDVTGDLVEKAAGLPQRNSAHPRDSGAIVTNIKPEQQNATVWFVRVTWNSRHGDTQRQSDNPTDDPVKIRWEELYTEEDRETDVNGIAFKDLAGTPLRNIPKIPVSYQRLIIEQNRLDFDPALARSYANKVNSDWFHGNKPGTCRMKQPTASEQSRNGQSYWRVVYVIDINEDGWQPIERKNEGPEYVCIFGGPGEPNQTRLMTDDLGVETGDVGLLDDVGDKLPKGREPIMLAFTIYKEKAFGPLNLT